MLQQIRTTPKRSPLKRRASAYYFMAVPAVALLFLFHTLPALQGAFYSLTDSTGFGPWRFIGFHNYVRLFHDKQLRSSYTFTIGFAVVTTILANVISLALALGLTARIRFRGFLRGVFFLPAVLASLIVSYIFNFIFSHVVPPLGRHLGITALSTNILGDPHLAWIGIVIVAVWQACATMTVIYMAGLQTVPEELAEAAVLEGATSWQRFRRITFPLIAPFFTVNVVLSLKGFLQVFDQIVALTGGGPGTSTRSIAFQIYRGGFSGGQFAYQSANAVVYFIVIAVVSIAQLRVLRRREVSA